MSESAREPRAFPPQPCKAIIIGRGMSMTYVAAKVGVSPASLRRIANSEAPPSPKIRTRLAEFLGLPESTLFDDRWGRANG